MDGARTILTASNWSATLQTILAKMSDPRHAQGTILALTSDDIRILRDMLTVLKEAHRQLGVEPAARSSADDGELDAATATANTDEDEDDDYGENDIIVEEEAEGGVGGMVDYGDAYRDGCFGGVPASASAMADRIKKRTYHEIEGGDDEGVARRTTAAGGCMICIEDFEAGDDLEVMPCSHRFHQGCLLEWLARSRLCPCCRYALPSEAHTRP